MIKKLTTDFVFSGVYYYVLVFALKQVLQVIHGKDSNLMSIV
jgi:hypothetical protein